MTMHKELHPSIDAESLYVSRREGGIWLASNEDTVNASIQRLENYIENRSGKLIAAIRNNINDTTSGTEITWKQK